MNGVIMLEQLIEKFCEAGILVQITIEGKLVTVDAFDFNRKLHRTAANNVMEALEMMAKKIFGQEHETHGC